MSNQTVRPIAREACVETPLLRDGMRSSRTRRSGLSRKRLGLDVNRDVVPSRHGVPPGTPWGKCTRAGPENTAKDRAAAGRHCRLAFARCPTSRQAHQRVFDAKRQVRGRNGRPSEVEHGEGRKHETAIRLELGRGRVQQKSAERTSEILVFGSGVSGERTLRGQARFR